MLLAGVFYFLISFFLDNYNQIKNVEITFDYLYLFVSISFFSVFLVNLALIWYLITKIFGCNLGIQRTIVYWFYSMLGKYIPGKLFLILGRVYLYDKNKIDNKKIIFSIALEIVCGLVAALIVAQISIPFLINAGATVIDIKYFYILIILTLITAHPKIIIFLVNIYNKISKKPELSINIKYSNVLLIILLFSINYFVLGLAFYYLVTSIYFISIENYLFLTSAYVLAGTIGILALFAPSGIGVRESVLAVLLPIIMPVSYAAVIVIISRLWETLIEIALTILLVLYAKTKNISFYL